MKETRAVQEEPATTPSGAEVEAFFDERTVSPESNLIALLQDAQDHFGYLPHSVLEGISRRTRLRLSRIYGVVSFYSQFHTEPRGRHTVRACRGTACHVKGSDRIIQTIERKLGVGDGESTPDLTFYFETVACLGTCFLGPAMMVDNGYFGRLTPRRVETILESFRAEA